MSTQTGNRRLEGLRSVPNRAPLLESAFVKLPIGDIAPRGWLLEQLQLTREGFVGHLPEHSQFCRDDSAWLTLEDKPAWEELPYWLRGYVDLGYVLKDRTVIAAAKKWLDKAIESQDESGYFGAPRNRVNKDAWPNTILLFALRAHFEATADARVLPTMTRYFKWRSGLKDDELFPFKWGVGQYNEQWWQHVRAGDELESIYWLYNRTGDEFLLKLSERIHKLSADWTNTIPTWHGVNICQGFREPVIYYQQAKDAKLIEAMKRNLQRVYDIYGQVPGGMFGADEDCREGRTGPQQAAETCSMVELMHACQAIFKITSETSWLDRCEDVAFNSLPASMTPDLRGLHYLTAPNMVVLDANNKAPSLANGGCMLMFSPTKYRCCQHNVAMGWPYFAEHLWVSTPARQDTPAGLAAIFYAACELTTRVGDTTVTITETTDYPFDDTIDFKFAPGTSAEFPLMLRIPSWCDGAKLLVNDQPVDASAPAGGFATIRRGWNGGDRVRLILPMKIRLTTWKANQNSVSVHRGPLTYSLKIGEKWQPRAGSEAWPEQEVLPTTPWNYGLIVNAQDPAASFRVERKKPPLADQPFNVNAAPIELVATGKRISAWKLDRHDIVGPLQSSPVRVGGPEEKVTLIPMGCARLRISAFPTIGSDSSAREWVEPPMPPHHASHEHDDIAALSDGILPKSSGDGSIPRFTWWAHRGTTEWVTWRFDKPRRVSKTAVYWFDDDARGYCRVPESWRLLYRSGDEWNPVKPAGSAGVEKDRFNELSFDAVESTELKLEVKLRPTFSGGILEWKVE